MMVLTAGCVKPTLPTPEPEITTLSLDVGRSVAAFSSSPFNENPTNATRHITQHFEVLDNETGVAFIADGFYDDTDAGANFTFRTGKGGGTLGNSSDDENVTVPYRIEAAPGNPNGDGTPIGRAFSFRQVLSFPPGHHNVTIAGHGLISSLNLQLITVPSEPVMVDEPFAVQTGTAHIEALVFASGAGPTPTFSIIKPDGSIERFETQSASGAHHVSFEPRAGEHVLRVESEGWAGSLGVRIEATPAG